MGIIKKKIKPKFNKNSEKKCPVVQLHSCQLNFCIPVLLSFSHIFLRTYFQINLFCLQAKSWVSRKEDAVFSHPEEEFSPSCCYWQIESRAPYAYLIWDVLPLCNRLKVLIKESHCSIIIKALPFWICVLLLKGSHHFLIMPQYRALLCYSQTFYRNHKHLPY